MPHPDCKWPQVQSSLVLQVKKEAKEVGGAQEGEVNTYKYTCLHRSTELKI